MFGVPRAKPNKKAPFGHSYEISNDKSPKEEQDTFEADMKREEEELKKEKME